MFAHTVLLQKQIQQTTMKSIINESLKELDFLN
jgi:hypothetical protein